jgi:hypothetical protein
MFYTATPNIYRFWLRFYLLLVIPPPY